MPISRTFSSLPLTPTTRVSPSTILAAVAGIICPKVPAPAGEIITKAKKKAIGIIIRGNKIIESGNEGFRIIWNE